MGRVEPPPAVLAMLEALAAADGVTVAELAEPDIRAAILTALATRVMPAIVPDDQPWPVR